MDMTDTGQPGTHAIDSYMGRVDAAARSLPPDRRVELLDQLREHLDAVSHRPRRHRRLCSRSDRPAR